VPLLLLLLLLLLLALLLLVLLPLPVVEPPLPDPPDPELPDPELPELLVAPGAIRGSMGGSSQAMSWAMRLTTERVRMVSSMISRPTRV